MRTRAGIIGAGLLGMALTAHAYTSPYSSMAVPGTHNGWATAPSMVLMADNTWVGTQTLSSASGEFKFAANDGWASSWGNPVALINFSIARVPAAATAFGPTITNLAYAGLSNGLYRFIFNDSTLAFRMEWAGASPLPLPAYSNMAVIGDFNGWSTNTNSKLTNSPANTNLWSGTITVQDPSPFQFQPDGNAAAQWGAPAETTVGVPVTNGSACGKFNFVFSGFEPGTFLFSLNTSNDTFAISQVSTQSFSLSTLTVQGNFIATNKPPANMTKISDTVWESDHHITNNGTVTLRFASTNSIQYWGATNGAPAYALPASGSLTPTLTNYAQVSGVSTGRYRITLNPLTGAFTFRRSYTEASGVNLLLNPGFEKTTLGLAGGDATNWTQSQAWPQNYTNGYAPHSGSWCGAIFAKLYSDWQNYGSLSQSNLVVSSGRTYRASAWFKATPDWTAEGMQIKIEWKDATNGMAGEDAILNLPTSLSTNWVKHSLEATAPANATKANVIFLCSGTGATGTMRVDDAEFRVASGRTQNFDSWGALASYGAFAPDWSVTSGKTVWNVAPGRPPAGVFISQYVEGTGNNKAVEIFNGTLSDLNLATYVLQVYNNGSTTPSTNITLSGTLQAGECQVFARPSVPPAYAPDAAISGISGVLTNKALTFNGDDVIVLRQGSGGPIKDRIGQVGTNAAGSMWSRNTTDRTLTRKSTIYTGTVTGITTSFPVSEWEISAKDNFDGLGTHEITYVDPNEPYTPGGYSLILNTNATLTGGDFPGGIGDVSFWWRTESMSPALTVSIDSAPSESGPWTTNATLSSLASSNFAYYAVAINRADALYLRIRQTAGSTNRFRIDEITVSEYSSTRRFEDFNAWTDPSYLLAGTHTRYGWSIQNSVISITNGASNTRAALLTPPDSAVVSPAYESGVGEVSFWAKPVDTNHPAYLLLQSSIDGGTNWTTRGSFAISNEDTRATWLYITNVGAMARIVFDPVFDSGDVLLDNIDVRIPALYRTQNFNGWPTKEKFTTGTATYQGWAVNNCIVIASNTSYESQSAQLHDTVGNFILSPYLPGGIGSFSFLARNPTNSGSGTLQIQLSANGSSWTTLDTVTPPTNDYQQYSWYIGTETQFFVRLYHSAGGGRLLIDNINSGVWQPRPQVIATPALDPSHPLTNVPINVTADVLTRYGASILSVSNIYQVTSSWPKTNGMALVSFGSYATTSSIPGLAAGKWISYQVAVTYAGVGAASNTTGYSTNIYLSARYTNWIATVPEGDVWINEIFYAPFGPDEPVAWDTNTWELTNTGENHEFVELCGLAGTDISGWTIQLAFGSTYDIGINTNAVYASYRIPTNSLLGNATNGYGFYVLGDVELSTNDEPVDLVFTNALPTGRPFADYVYYKDHMYDGVGVVRLLDQFSNTVYSLSYLGFANGSDNIPQRQGFSGETNSIGLVGTNTTYAGFEWWMGLPTIGTPNDGPFGGQTLIERVPETNIYVYAWHTPGLLVTPADTNLVSPFHMLNPQNAAQYDTIAVHYGYTNADYPSAGGILYHRPSGGGAWSAIALGIYIGAGDADGHGYVRGAISPHTYDRLQTIQYVIEVDPNKTGVQTVYLGGAGANVSTFYTNLTAAQANPFTCYLPIADVIVITNYVIGATNTALWTGGNDPIDPLVNFYIRTATNLQLSTDQWGFTNYTGSTNIYGEWMFNIRKTTNAGVKLFYRIDPRWP